MTDLVSEPAPDPDAQAVITDFLDFTEHFPSDLLRSLTLIRGLDETYQTNAFAVHDLTKVYGSLPTYSPSSRPNAQALRSEISTRLDRALTVRESSYAEAARLFDAADRHYNRLQSILAKLNALPKPPSRDPTPQPTKSPQTKRSRSGRNIESGTSIQRLTLNPPRGSTIATAILHRPRHRRVTVPGEVLPPFDPDSPIASTEVSDWDEEPSALVRPVLKLKTIPTKEKENLPKARERHDSSILYRKPTPPPEDAELGGKFRPWTRLTEWEMYKLRKKMKKNHNWEPSEVMIRRELAERGRGWDNYYRGRAEAQAKGRKLLDCDNLDRGPTKVEKTETPATASATSDKAQGKKGEQRKSKQDPAARSQAQIAAQEAELAARRLGDIGSAFKNLFSPFSSALASLNRSTSSPIANGAGTGRKGADKAQKKRKLEEVDASASPGMEDAAKKKQKVVAKPSPLPPIGTPTPAPTTIKIPLKLTVPRVSAEPSNTSSPAPTSRAPSSRAASIAPKTEATPPAASRPVSSRSTVEPATSIAIRLGRRTSTPATHQELVRETTPRMSVTAASRRSKREAPGTVTQSSQDGGAAVSVSSRKTKPAKKMAHTSKVVEAPVPEIRVDVDGKQEIVDPEEERYCICGDVSWGEMICCEFDEKASLFLLRCKGLILTNGGSASLGNGSIWSACHCRSYHLEQLNGIVQVIGRNTTKESIRTVWSVEASNERGPDHMDSRYQAD